jgi:hypothetical protein
VEKRSENWLDDIFPQAKQQREQMQKDGLRFSQNYLVFHGPTSDPRARALLEHWTKVVRRRRMAPGATAEERAAFDGVREWVEGIWSQIEIGAAAQEPEWLKS